MNNPRASHGRRITVSGLLIKLLERAGVWRWWPKSWLTWAAPKAAAVPDYRQSRLATRLETLEPRILLSADLMPGQAQVVERVQVHALTDVQAEASAQAAANTPSSPGATVVRLVPGLLLDTIHQQWPQTQSLTLTAALQTDSGSSATDHLTNDPSLVVTPGAAVTGAVTLRARLSSTEAFQDVNVSRAADGGFTLGATELARLKGSALTDGDYTVELRLKGSLGATSAGVSVSFKLDRAAPGAPTALALAAASDTGVIGDLLTNAASVTITGQTEANAVVKLGTTQVTADANGVFQFDNVALVAGSNTLSVQALDAAGNLSSAATATIVRDSTAPSLTLALKNDTGSSASDAVTADPTLSATVSEPGSIQTLQARFGSTGTFTTLAVTPDAAGKFELSRAVLTQLNGGTLPDGSYQLQLQATDKAGNLSAVQSLAFTLNTTTATLAVQIALKSDTGSSASDAITRDATIRGQVNDASQLQTVQARLGSTAAFTTLTVSVAADGSFEISPAQLAQLNGGSLPDGSYQLQVKALDKNGGSSAVQTLAFTLDTAGATLASLTIASADALNGDTSQTAAGRVTLRGSLDAGATISLGSQSLSAQAGAGGVLQLPDVTLATGANTLSFTVTDAAGNSSTVSKTFTRVTQSQTDQVLGWNSIALKAIQLDVTDPPVATRTLAMQSLAVYDVLAAIEGTPAYVVQRSVSGPVSADVAVAVASHRILSLTYPAQRSQLDNALAASLATVVDGAAKDTGIALGLDIANAVWASRQNDGSDAYVIYNGSTATGAWRPTGPNYLLPDEPQWGDVTPFALTSPSEFRPVAPPALDTAAYADAINQVKSLGAANSTTRTADQTQQAHFWADGKGSYTPPGHWNQIAEQVAQAQGNSLSANARLFAQLNVALADAAIACWDAKYTYGAWRPETAIQNADADNNAATVQDANWTSLLINPAHPDYVSGHSTFSAAAATVLASTFGDATSFTTTSATLPGVTRSYTSFSQAASEAGLSRIYGGIHTGFANTAGQALGTSVANAVLSRFTLKQDTQAPAIALQDSADVVKTSPTFSGQLFDNLSGVQTVTWQVDAGNAQALTLGATGGFSLPTALASDGTADGVHTLTITATDVAGNTRTVTRSFTLDTKAPTVDLSSVADGAALDASSRLTGSANATGSTIVSLSYQFDSGKVRAVIYDTSTGSFDQSLALGDLAIGDHTLKITAQDAAGNVTTLSRAVKIEALAPLTVTKVTPADGSGDVGVTFRPQVYFSRAVNTATLTTSSFYATGPDGAQLDITLVPASDGSFCWMYFNSPMPSGSLVTLHLKGSAIRAAQDGSFLDADGDGTAGGELSWSFTTVNTAGVLGTKLVGKVVDPGADLEPMTFDDIGRGADGVIHTADDVFKSPIVGAKVYIIGRPDLVTTTDENGNFSFDNVPVGDVKVGVDGRTATNPPTGIFWPEMVMDVVLKPGITNTLMGSMGSTASQQDNADRAEIYLPRVQSSAMQTVSGTEVTRITVDAASAPDLTDEQRSQLTLTVNPGTAVGSDGKVLQNVSIGINTVPPELVKDMLPPGVLEHTYDITIQAPGVDTFIEPVQITFPNVFNAAPGTKLNILSFDHTTGRLVINGTATVSVDGKTVVSDQGSGVVAPGWHGLVPTLVNAAVKFIKDIITNPEIRNNIVDVIKALASLKKIFDATASVAKIVVPVFGAAVGAVLGFPAGGPVGSLAGAAAGAYAGQVLSAFTSRAIYLVSQTIDGLRNGESLDQLYARYDAGAPKFIAELIPGVGLGIQIYDSYTKVIEGWNSIKELSATLGPKISNLIAQFDTSTRLSTTPPETPNLQTNPVGDFELLYRFAGLTLSTEEAAVLPGLANIVSQNSLSLLPADRDLIAVTRVYSSAVQDIQRGSLSTAEKLATIEKLTFVQNNILALTDYSARRAHDVTNLSKIYNQIGEDFNLFDNISAAYDTTTIVRYDFDGQSIIKTGTGASDFSAALPLNREVIVSSYIPAINKIAQTIIWTGSVSTSNILAQLAFEQGGTDTDADGLPDQAEAIYGTSANSADSDADGISDMVEILNGNSPIGLQPQSTGLVGLVSLFGQANSVEVIGGTADIPTRTAYLATGDYGLAIVNVDQSQAPIVRSQLDLSGQAVAVAIDSTRALAAVAAGSSGLHIVDVATPSAPRLLCSVNLGLPATAVQVRDAVAYVAAGNTVSAVDLNTGDILASLAISTSAVLLNDLKIDGNTLFVIDNQRNLRAVDLAGGQMSLRGSINLVAAGGGLFVGGGVAYVGRDDSFNGGYSTVDVRDPANLVLLSGVDSNNVAGGALAANGSGLLVTVGSPGGVFGVNAIDVLDGTDPTNTAATVTRYTLPAKPLDVALANGLAFVAGGTAGLQIVNFIGFDAKGVAPTVSITAEALDADPATAGTQVLEGQPVRILPAVRDDVQVRSVELLVNGQVLASDVAFPWELFTQAPTLAAGGPTMTIQVRATDTGGNSTLSDPVVLDVVPDTFAPQVQTVSVAEGASLYFVRSVDVAFDEPIDLTKLTTAGVHLVRAGADGLFDTADDVAMAVKLDSRALGQRISVLPADFLTQGSYRLTIDAAAVSDKAGNALAEPIVRNFSIKPASQVRAASGTPEIPNAPSANPGQEIGVPVSFDPKTARMTFAVVDVNGNKSTLDVVASRWDAAKGMAYFRVPFNALSGDATVFSQVGSTKTVPADGVFPLQVLPVITDVQVQAVDSSGGTATVLLTGYGFVEGNGTEYRFGNTSIVDDSTTLGPNVTNGSPNGASIANGGVSLTVQLTDGAFGPISVKTAGGTSAVYTTSLSGVTATALSGIPADAAKASANPGQAITLTGSGLNMNSDLLLTYTGDTGLPVMVRLSPTAVAQDGRTATLILPDAVNGIAKLQMVGASGALEVQIVPVIDPSSRTWASLSLGQTVLGGLGFVEGATTYRFSGATVTDTATDAGANVSDSGSRVSFDAATLPNYSAGTLTVTTAGGTSAAVQTNFLRPAVSTDLGDVAVDAAGKLWIADNANPGHLLQIDPASGQTLKTLTMSSAWGTQYVYDYVGLQVLTTGMTLGSTAVPAGSLLVFNGQPNTDVVVAVDPATGTVLASLTLAANHDLRAGVYDAVSGHLFVLSNTSNQLVEIDATNGASLSSHTLAVNVQSTAGLAIDPTNGNLWVASANAGNQLVQVTKAGVEVRRYDVSSPEVGWVSGWQISGLAFAADGKLWMSTSTGLVLHVNVNADPATRNATLSEVLGAARNGTAAQAGVASANVGDVIELRGSNFGAGTQVLFQVRSIEGVVSTVAVQPLLIGVGGTTLQVKVPDLATTADVQVVNIGSRDLGFSSSYNDAIYRQVSTTFTAGGSNAVIRFADGGLEGLTNESWGLDNVKVSQGGTLVFSDDFEGAAKANWSNATVDASETANFSRFSGRFSNSGQSLSLSGLSAGQTYTLSFDLYAIDSWDGQGNVGYGPDEFDVSVDGTSVLRENLSNYSINDVQSLNASAGVRLQIVPTLSGLSAVTGPGGILAGYTLTGSGFMEGASSIRVGGVDFADTANNQSSFNVTGNNSSYTTVITAGSLDGPIRISTAGGWAELPNTAASWGDQPVVAVTGLSAAAGSGQAADVTKLSANTGQTIVFTGQGFTSSTLVQFTAEDASGQIGTATRTGTVSNSGTTLSVIVPVNARTGSVSVLGSGVSQQLQIVPTITAMGGTAAAGNTLVLEGTGLTTSDLQVQIDGRGVGDFQVKTINFGSGSNPDQQLLTLTVPAGVSAGRITVSTAGGLMDYQAGVSLTSDAGITPASDAGDSLATAQAITLLPDHQASISSNIGDGAQTTRDVDLYKIELNAGDTLSLTMSGIAGRVRIFDANGNQLASDTFVAAGTSAALSWVAPAGGSYYLGVSGSGNSGYNPATTGSGTASSTGNYVLGISRLGAGSSRLSGTTASATSGTPAQAGVASANTGQSITLKGVGLVAGDKVIFTLVDNNGNQVESAALTPTSLDLINQTLTVTLPTNATTGHVRLARDQAGVLLQIVPTLSDVTMPVNGNFEGGTLTLTGTGFADGATAVQFGAVRIDDVSQSAGLSVSNTSIGMTVPNGVSSGPIRIITAGGTSAAFGASVTGLSGTAASGSAQSTAASANAGQVVSLTGSGFDTSLDVVFQVINANGARDEVVVRPSTVSADGTQAQVVVPLNAITGVVRVVGDRNNQSLVLQIVPVITDVQVQSVATDGSTATVLISGSGFIEGHNSEYRFGTGANGQVLIDGGISTGANVLTGQVTLTVPLSAGMFGPITVKTAGGTSAVFATSLGGVTATALSGTPADAAKASANPGQSVTLNGTRLSTATDVLVGYTDYNGNAVMVKLNPSSAAANGTSATLTLPDDLNGMVTLQVLGSSSQPQLQIVPVLTSWDENGSLNLYGAGFVEGATSFKLSGATVNDTVVNVGADVWYRYDASRGVYVYNGAATLDTTTLPSFGAGAVTVTTAGGTSAALELNVTRIAAAGTSLGDVAVDASGKLWVIDAANPANVRKIDPLTGQVLQTITATAAWGGTYASAYAGLQLLAADMMLGTTAVPAGSLLIVNGQPVPDQVVALNPGTGAVVARLDLSGIAGLDITSGMYDAATGHLFVLWYGKNELAEIDPVTGSLIGSHALPVIITTSAAGVVADPTSGNLWVGSTATGSQIVEVTKAGVEVRRMDLSDQGVNQGEISGLAFGPDGKLWVSSTQGVVYRVDLGADPAIRSAALSQVIGAASNGTAAQAGVASANVGDVIELRGSHFGAGTEVLFQIRDNNGVVGTVAVAPLVIDQTGTRLQVKVPDLATTGDVRVVNTGVGSTVYSGHNGAIYRQITRTFTAGSSTALIRFADGGLQGLGDESWGLDNVKVSQGSTVIFSDDFENGAKANWSNATVDASITANFSRFSGRFSNNGQSLSLSGLTARQTYTLAFDLYALDSWDGENTIIGPDIFSVSADGVSLLQETISNYSLGNPQSLNASAGVKLQIVPTLSGLSSITAPGSGANQYTVTGSGFMEGASTLRVGGLDFADTVTNLTPFDVSGVRNDTMTVVTPSTLDGPVRITTEGGWAQLSNTADGWGVQPVVSVTGFAASAGLGTVADPTKASANTGQTIVFTGQGFTASTLVQFAAEDASGQIGTVTRTGTVGAGGTTLSVLVPVHARTGAITVLGSGRSDLLQIVPTITAMGGAVVAGNTLVLEGTGLTASDLQVQIDGRGVGSFEVKIVNVGMNSDPDQQLLTLTVPAGVSAGRITVSTAGGQMVYQTGVSLTSDTGITPTTDAGDSLTTAQAITLLADHQLSVNGNIGDGTQTTKDVDLYKLDLGAGDTLSLTMSGLAGRLRVFDANGVQLAAQTFVAAGTTVALDWVAPSSGSYYLGVSGSANTSYNPATAGSGTASTTGNYVLSVARLGAGSSHLSGITATATSGTAAQTGVASANTGQSITLKGVGLVAGDKLVFTTVNANGSLTETTVTPASINVVNQTLTAVVPTTATTGHVRLARDQAGVLLQIVPTLSDMAMPVNGNFEGGTLTLTGTGFADGATAVQFGAVRIDDVSQSAGLSVSNTSISMTVPNGVPSGPIRIITAGGTSATFGASVTVLTGPAASGTAGTAGASANPGQVITLTGSGFDTSLDIVFQVINYAGTRDEVVVRPSTVSADGTQAQVTVPLNAITGSVRVVGDRNAQALNLQIVPIVTGVQVQSVASDGSAATLVLSGYGFVEGNNSEYRFGTGASGLVLLDAGISTGAQVQQVLDSARAQYHNGQVTLTVPITAGAFGPVEVKTAGGVSAVYSTHLSGVTATALSGTPADATKASANPGQAVTLAGSGLSTATDVLLAYTDDGGNKVTLKLSPSSAAQDGTSATLVLPTYVNGVVTLQVFGASGQPQVQVVPVLKGWDESGSMVLTGAGLVEGGTTYSFAGVSVNDTVVNTGPDVYSSGSVASLDTTVLPSFGAGLITVTTAGGTSAALNLNATRARNAGLGDVAVDAAGKLWVSDNANPGHLLKIDEATGQVLQTITATTAWGVASMSTWSGLQVLGAPMTLGTVSVPAGSLLVVNGAPNPDKVVALDPATGAVIASLNLASGLDLTSGMFDAASGHLFGLVYNNSQMVELDPATGAILSTYTLPASVAGAAGLVADPSSGNLWFGSTATGSQIIEVTKKGVEVRRADLVSQGVNQQEISGLAFAADGSLRVSSTQGVVYLVRIA